MCVRIAASDSKIVSQIVQLCTVDTAVTKSPKLYAGKSRAHAAFTIVCHALVNSVHNLFQCLGSALNSGRSDSFHPSLARRACKSSVMRAMRGVIFPRAFCRRALSCGKPARAARATFRNRSRRSNVCIPGTCNSARSSASVVRSPAPRHRPAHYRSTRIQAVLKHLNTAGVHAIEVPVAKRRMDHNNVSASRNLVRSGNYGEPKTSPANARYTTIIALTLAVASSVSCQWLCESCQSARTISPPLPRLRQL